MAKCTIGPMVEKNGLRSSGDGDERGPRYDVDAKLEKTGIVLNAIN